LEALAGLIAAPVASFLHYIIPKPHWNRSLTFALYLSYPLP